MRIKLIALPDELNSEEWLNSSCLGLILPVIESAQAVVFSIGNGTSPKHCVRARELSESLRLFNPEAAKAFQLWESKRLVRPNTFAISGELCELVAD